MQNSTEFGARLWALRKGRKMSREELGEKLGISYMTIRRWEIGERSPRMEEIKQICKVFGVEDTVLLYGTKEEDEWKLTIKMGGTNEMIDLASNACVSDIELAQNGAALRLGGSYAVFEDDEKFEDFIRQLRSARNLVIESGRKMRNIGNKAEG